VQRGLVDDIFGKALERSPVNFFVWLFPDGDSITSEKKDLIFFHHAGFDFCLQTLQEC
jgi:hypothetical protein